MQLLYRINRCGHDRAHGHARPRDGRQDAPPRDRARGRAARARRAPRRLRRVRFRVVVAEAWRSLTASLSTTIAAALTVLIGMFLVGLLIGLGTWARSWANHVKGQLDVNVYICTQHSCGQEVTRPRRRTPSASAPERSARSSPSSSSRRQQALENMKKKSPEHGHEAFPRTRCPDAFKVTPKHGEDVERDREQPRPAAGRRREGQLRQEDGATRILRVAHMFEVAVRARDRDPARSRRRS